MAHVWLACAYGQKHAALKLAASASASAGVRQQLAALSQKAAEQVEKAVAVDPNLKQMVRALYVPELAVGGDDDLNSLYPDEAIDAALGSSPPT
jgi:hypothetical protein